jgi:hypothetical protein
MDSTAIHEAGHAALQIALRLGFEQVTVVPDYEDMTAGASTHGGEYGRAAQELGEEDDDTANLRFAAEDAFMLRHAIACYAGAEAVRQLRRSHPDPDAGAEDDFCSAVDYINRITDDAESIDLYFKLAKRRCAVLVEHYSPEIEALAAQLEVRKTLRAEEAIEIFFQCLRARRAGLLSW